MNPTDKPKKKHFRSGGYSREFTPGRGKGKSYNLTRIPLDLWADVRRKAKEDKTSLRTTILKLLKEWVTKP